MSPRLHSLLVFVGALALMMIGLSLGIAYSNTSRPETTALEQLFISTSTQTASVGTSVVSSASSTIKQAATSSIPSSTPTTKKAPSKATKIATTTKAEAKKPAENVVVRVQDPYPFPPQPITILNDTTRLALVNIVCSEPGNFSRSTSGSGVIIDPRGIVLTNAHVAQYVLLSQNLQTNISCAIRAGSPAIARWAAIPLFISPAWVEAHAHEINMVHASGTGEHDYALLLITQSLTPSPLPAAFPFLPVDTREAIGFQGDQVLVASYPAEFVGAPGVSFGLYPVTSITTIRQLLTFLANTVDLLSLGGIVGAQSGSSGGAVVNAWGFLIGLIATTSEGDTTATRDLRAVTLSYINRDLIKQTQFDLATILTGDVAAEALDFNTRIAPQLINLYLK